MGLEYPNRAARNQKLLVKSYLGAHPLMILFPTGHPHLHRPKKGGRLSVGLGDHGRIQPVFLVFLETNYEVQRYLFRNRL
jgi:hypothetical protein